MRLKVSVAAAVDFAEVLALAAARDYRKARALLHPCAGVKTGVLFPNDLERGLLGRSFRTLFGDINPPLAVAMPSTSVPLRKNPLRVYP